MCLYPKLILNPKYRPNKKNNYKPPKITDIRTKYVPIGCGNCIECRKQKANGWRLRLTHEIKEDKKCYFVTLTFSNESLIKLIESTGIDESNYLLSLAVRRFLERWRKKYKKSVKHFLISERGHNGTERIHLHGLIWCENKEDIEKIWQYGYVFVGDYVNEQTINYIVKYITKIDQDHKDYNTIILNSPGLGKGITKTIDFKNAKFDGKDTQETIRLPNGYKIAMPIYLRNKRYNEEEREQLWLNKLDQQKRYVLGEEINVSTQAGEEEYLQKLKLAQEKNKRCGYGDNSQEWKKKPYNITMRMLNAETKKEQEKQRYFKNVKKGK